jgi:hypothetical protein
MASTEELAGPDGAAREDAAAGSSGGSCARSPASADPAISTGARSASKYALAGITAGRAARDDVGCARMVPVGTALLLDAAPGDAAAGSPGSAFSRCSRSDVGAGSARTRSIAS